LPLGFSFDPASGRIFGIPAVAGNFPITLRALNSGGIGSAGLNLTINPEPPPLIDSITVQDGISLSFLTLTNKDYAVEWIADLLSTNWATLTDGIPGNAADQTATDSITNAPRFFYRLKVTAP
jgi:hypothetical protein